jgi:HTH-type transcriptional regulator/antitoxin HigA
MTTRTTPHLRDDYLKLIRLFPLRPIRTPSQHAQALTITSTLLTRTRKLTSGESDYLDALILLLRDYESLHNPPAPHLPALQLLQFLVSESNLGVSGLGRLIGVGKSAASLILSGKRELTKSHIAKLSTHFHLSPEVFFH